MADAPWTVLTHDIAPRTIPDELRNQLTAPSAVEDLSDGLLSMGIKSVFNFRVPEPGDEIVTFVGPVVTARYVPRRTPGNDLRLGHAKIAEHMAPGSLVVMDAAHCTGSVCGGKAALTLRDGGAAAVIIDGMARDNAEIRAGGVVVWANSWGVATGRQTNELYEVGGVITFRGVTVWPDDVAVVNQYGGVFVPSWVSWETVHEMLKNAAE